MKKDYADITVVLDRSGSMSSCVNDVIGGFNTFIEDQKKQSGEATVSLYQFDNEYEVVYENKKIADVPALSNETFIPRGMTALLDAVGKTIATLGEKYSKMKEEDRPEKVFFVVITDGQENSSQEYMQDRVQEMIKLQKETYSWIFVFLGADITSINLALNLGVPLGNTMQYGHTGCGYDASFKSISKNMTKLRCSTVNVADAVATEFFDSADRQAQEDIIRPKRASAKRKTK
jgi:Mg-chelatase subunit ChlD